MTLTDDIVANGAILCVFCELGGSLAPGLAKIADAGRSPGRRRLPVACSCLRCLVRVETAVVVGHSKRIIIRSGCAWASGSS